MSKVLIAGRSREDVLQLQASIVALGAYETAINVIVNGHADPLYGLSELPAVLVLILEADSKEELLALSERPLSARVPLIVIGNALDPATMRVAMQSGARDFLDPESDQELLASALQLLFSETRVNSKIADSRQIAVINASGGSGATTVAVNLAHAFATKSKMQVGLIDLDLQFAPTSQYFDIKATRGLLEALERIDEMDTVALEGYFSIHSSGIELLSALPTVEIPSRDNLDGQFTQLTELMQEKYERVIIDMPSQLDALSAAALESSDHILVVLQQNLVSIQNAARLLDYMRHDLAIPDSRLVLVVNRFDKNSTIEIVDVKRTVKEDPVFVLPNQYKAVAESINFGIPVLQQEPNSPLSKAIIQLEEFLGGKVEKKRSGFIANKLSSLLGA